MRSEKQPIKVFYSYSHKDEKLRRMLETHLSILQRQGLIAEWHDRCVSFGEEWVKQINESLESADLILLLITPDFVASNYCYDIEMQRALERHEAGTARVIPIIFRPTDWENSPFGKLQCLPTDGMPVTKWRNLDAAFLNIIQGIRSAAMELKTPMQVPGETKLRLAKLRKAYLQLMAAEWRRLPLEALDPNTADLRTRPLTLEQIYISLDTTTPRPGLLNLIDSAESGQPPLSALEAFSSANQHRLVLLGQPGSGKSTFARYLAKTMAEALLNPRVFVLTKYLPGWIGPALIPVFVSLRQLAASLTTATGPGTVGQIEDFIRFKVDEYEVLTGFGLPLLAKLRARGGLVIFDGLDEIIGTQRLRINQALIKFAALYKRCWILVTCRVPSYHQDPASRLDWATHTLAGFNDTQIAQFIDTWYRGLAALNPGSYIDYVNKAKTLKAALSPNDPRRLRDLAEIPLLITIMAIIHTHRELPLSRVALYREVVDILQLRWQTARAGVFGRQLLLDALLPYSISARQVHQGLCELAYQAHRRGERSSIGSDGRALLSDTTIREVMCRWLGEQGVQVFLDYCQHSNGLLLADRIVQHGENGTEVLYSFLQLSFEEYLAALYLLQMPNRGIQKAVALAADPAWWEVVRFYGEYLCSDAQGGNLYLAKTLLEELCPIREPTDDDDWRRIQLAGVLLSGWLQEASPDIRVHSLEERIAQRIASLPENLIVRNTLEDLIKRIAEQAGKQTQLHRLDSIVALLPKGNKGILIYTSKLQTMVGEICQLQRRLEINERPFLREPIAELLCEKIKNIRNQIDGFPSPWAEAFDRAACHWLAIAEEQHHQVKAILARKPKPQMFQSGKPIDRRQEAFVLRAGVLGELDQQLTLSNGCPGLFLYGRRRMGKSTMLQNLDDFLPISVRVATVSMQSARAFKDQTSLLNQLAQALLTACPVPNLSIPETLDLAAFSDLLSACNIYLATDNRRLLLALDEYEYLDRKIGEGIFSEDLLATLRDSMQFHRQLTWVFAGSQAITELHHAPWPSYLIGVFTVEVQPFTEAETHLLLTQPLKYSPLWEKDDPERPNFDPLFWGEGGIERIHSETGGWPNLVQLLAYTIVNLCNDREQNQVNPTLLEQAISKTLMYGDVVLRQLLQAEDASPSEWEYLRGFRTRDTQPPPDDETVYQALRRRLLVESVNNEWRLRIPLMQRWLRERG